MENFVFGGILVFTLFYEEKWIGGIWIGLILRELVRGGGGGGTLLVFSWCFGGVFLCRLDRVL
jgi:hypothetical protein